MTFARSDHISDVDTLTRMPAWVTSGRAESPEHVAFLSGAALNHLHLVLGHEQVPHALLRDRRALRPAGACVTFSGRPERAGQLRDAVHQALSTALAIRYHRHEAGLRRVYSEMQKTRAIRCEAALM
jgi:hypothetical protein